MVATDKAETADENSLRALIRARVRMARLTVRGGAGLVAVLLLLEVLLGLLPVAFVIETSVVLGRVPAAIDGGFGSAAWSSLVSAFVLGAVTFVAQQILAPLATALGELLARRIDGQVYAELMSSSLSPTGVGPLEDPAVVADLRMAASELRYAVQSPGQGCAGLLALIPNYLQLTGFCLVVGFGFAWVAAACLAVTVLLFRWGQRGGLRRYAEKRYQLDAMEQEIEYLRRLAIEPPAGKEIRIFGLDGWLRERLSDVTRRLLVPLWAARRQVYMWPFVWFALFGAVAMGVAFGLLGASPVESRGLTAFVLVAQSALAALQLGRYYPESDLQTTFGMFASDAVRRFSRSVGATPLRSSTPPAAPEPATAIHFDNVTFRYPGADRPILDGLDLTIPAGRCTAIVGHNGVGKTTLVKLLTRLYEPTAGTIRSDGVDVREYPAEAWRSRLSVIFQQFIRFEESVADNIGMGSAGHLGDRTGIEASAAAVGLGDLLAGLPKGADTLLARHLTDGAELSGGQWQRLALARALFALRHGASLLVLDEPTANLDVRAEVGFFEEFARLTRGATTVLISHRFSTVRHADLIVVLGDGGVAEQGSHAELMAAGGTYARLFRLQADLFLEKEDVPG